MDPALTVESDTDRPAEAERSASSRDCAHCGHAFTGRRDKRFCSDACRTAHRRGREAEKWARVERAVTELQAAISAARDPHGPD